MSAAGGATITVQIARSARAVFRAVVEGKVTALPYVHHIDRLSLVDGQVEKVPSRLRRGTEEILHIRRLFLRVTVKWRVVSISRKHRTCLLEIVDAPLGITGQVHWEVQVVSDYACILAVTPNLSRVPGTVRDKDIADVAAAFEAALPIPTRGPTAG